MGNHINAYFCHHSSFEIVKWDKMKTGRTYITTYNTYYNFFFWQKWFKQVSRPEKVDEKETQQGPHQN